MIYPIDLTNSSLFPLLNESFPHSNYTFNVYYKIDPPVILLHFLEPYPQTPQ